MTQEQLNAILLAIVGGGLLALTLTCLVLAVLQSNTHDRYESSGKAAAIAAGLSLFFGALAIAKVPDVDSWSDVDQYAILTAMIVLVAGTTVITIWIIRRNRARSARSNQRSRW